MKKHLSFFFAAIALIAGALWFTACQKDNAEAIQPDSSLSVDDRTPGDSKVFPPTAHPYGKSYGEWTEVWLQQFYNTFDCANNGWNNPANVLFYQSGPVYILAGVAEVGGSVSITVPHGKALLFPLVNVWWNMCPGEVPGPGQTVAEYLLTNTTNLLNSAGVTNLSVTVDGSPVSNMSSYKIDARLFEYTGNQAWVDCDPCTTGDPQPVAMAGYFAIIKPLSKGQHAVHYHMEAPGWGPTVVQDATYNITVQ